jgi:hypothetical protein
MSGESLVEQMEEELATQTSTEGQDDAVGRTVAAAGDGRQERPVDEVAASLARIEKSLDRIVDHLHHTHRVDQIREFSLSDLAGAVCVVVSAVCIIGAVLSLLRTDVRSGLAWATVAFLGAIALQGLSLALFRLSRRK